MSGHVNKSSSGVAIQDLYPEYVWDTEESCGTEESDLDQKSTEPEENQGLQEEPDPSDLGKDEEDGLFQSNLVSFYLQDVSQFQLLSLEREIELARTMKEGEERLVNLIVTHCASAEIFGNLRSQILRYQSEVATYPGMREKIVEHIFSTLECLSAAEGAPEICRRLAVEARLVVDQIELARDEMVKGNLRLVLSIAKRYRGRGLSFLDLIQEGNMGLLKAVSRYDYTKGNRFSTYATWWVRQSIIRAIYEKTNTIRLPVHVIEMKSFFHRVFSELSEELNREPMPMEIAERSGLPLEKVTMLSQLSCRPASLEAKVGNKEQPLSDFIEDRKSSSPLEGISQSELVEATRKVLASLSPREEGVLKSRFGIDGVPVQTLKTIGGRLGVSKERIRQIEKRAIQKLRHTSRSAELECFME
jgi:RNA polymerase primary sigma factor